MAEAFDTPKFEEVVELKKAQDVRDDGQPKPDMPVTIAAPAYGDSGHVNPAINPAPIWKPQADRVIVPVQNDPGVLGSAPSLGDLNRAYRADDMQRAGGVEQKQGKRPEIDDTAGVTEENNQEDVRKAAEARLQRLADQIGEAEKTAKEIAQEQASANSKAGAKPVAPAGTQATGVKPQSTATPSTSI